MAFWTGLGALAVLEVLEWQVVLVGAARVLSRQHRRDALRAVGEALEHG